MTTSIPQVSEREIEAAIAAWFEYERNGGDCDDLGEHLKACLSAASQVRQAGEQGWQPVETAPKDGKCLLYVKNIPSRDGDPPESHSIIAARRWCGQWRVSHTKCGQDVCVSDDRCSHWMPLPAAPQSKGEAG